MSGVPKEIPGFGDATIPVRLNPEFDALGASGLTTESYFVLSRVDGRASLRELILMSGLAVDRAVGILGDLRRRGALLLPAETPDQLRAKLAVAADAGERRVAMRRPDRSAPAPDDSGDAALDLDESNLSSEERAALDEDNVMGASERRRVLAMRRRIRGADLFAVLGVPRDADKRTLKRVYFKLSKEFHPDRYYGKATGSFGPWLAEVFETCSKAYDTLSDASARAAYEARLRGAPAASASAGGQSKAEHAASLFAEACSHEVRGDAAQALRLFAAVIRVDPQASYLRRAAQCALGARDHAMAEDYAKKAVGLAPRDPSIARLLASVYRARDKLDDAERTLLGALEMKNENDVLSTELQEDLAAIRKLRETR